MSLRSAGVAAAAAVLLAASCAIAASGRGTEFWGAWPRSHASLETSAVLVVTAEQPTPVAVDGAFVASGIADRDAPWIVRIPETLRTAVDRVTADVGFRIRSTDGVTPISVLFRVPEQAEASDDIARLLPVTELGTRYVVTAYTASIPNGPSYYAVIATRDGTTVTTLTSCGGDPGPVLLDAGQVYQVFCRLTDTPPDVTGSIVSSDKPVAVLAGVSTAWVPTDYLSGDFLVEALAPVSAWGGEFFVAPLPKGADALDPADVVRVTASRGLDVTFDDGAATQTVPLTGEGDWLEARITGPVRISTTAPADVHLFATGYEASGIGDPFQCDIPPTASYFRYLRAYIPPDYTEGSFVDLFAPTSATAAVRFAGQGVPTWTSLPGGAWSWARVDLGQFSGTRLIASPQPVGAVVYGFNDAYRLDPDLGRVPGSYGYPAAESLPSCRIDPMADVPTEACPGTQLVLDGGDSVPIGCSKMEYRWLLGSAPIPGCGFSTTPTCAVAYTGPAEYVLEVRCADDPTSCAPGVLAVSVGDVPPEEIQLAPDPAEVCEGRTLTITAPAGYGLYEWTSVPADPGVTPQSTVAPRLTVSPDVDTVYSVRAQGGTGCLGVDDLPVSVLPDPIPPPMGNTLFVSREGAAGLRLRWTDLAQPVSGYEAVALACAARDACPTPPAPAVLEGRLAAAPAVGPGVGTLTLPAPAGEIVYLKVRGLSPCSGRAGPLCDGFPVQVPCP